MSHLAVIGMWVRLDQSGVLVVQGLTELLKVLQKDQARCIWMFPKIVGFPPKSSILIGFSIINHPFWGIPIFGNTYIYGWNLTTKWWKHFTTKKDNQIHFSVMLGEWSLITSKIQYQTLDLLLMAKILHQLRLVVYPIIYRVWYRPRWLFGISEPSTVWSNWKGPRFCQLETQVSTPSLDMHSDSSPNKSHRGHSRPHQGKLRRWRGALKKEEISDNHHFNCNCLFSMRSFSGIIFR